MAPQDQTIDDKIEQAKLTEFTARLNSLQKELGVVVVPILKNSRLGIVPDWVPMVQEKFHKVVENIQNGGSF